MAYWADCGPAPVGWQTVFVVSGALVVVALLVAGAAPQPAQPPPLLSGALVVVALLVAGAADVPGRAACGRVLLFDLP